MQDYILKAYDDYKIYMGLSDDIMPSLNPVIFKDVARNKSKIAYVNADEVMLPTVNLYVNSTISDYNERFKLAKLYHEFTHILDGITLSKDFEFEDLIHIMSTYSEYHASQIELAYNIGFKNIHSFRKINLDKTFVNSENEKISVIDDYIQPMADALVIIDKPFNAYDELNAVEYYQNYSWFETKSMYYLGKENLCSKISFSTLPNVTDIQYGKFAPYIRNIEQCIQKKNYQGLIKARKELREFYTSYFICKQNCLLLE